MTSSETPQEDGPADGPAGHAFLFVIAVVTLDMLAFGLIIPVLPSLLAELTRSSVEEAVIWAGPLTATFALLNFLAMPTIGALSDRYGRRPVLLASVATLAIDFLIMATATSLAVLFFGRALSGISAATFSTANAYIADVTRPENRAKAFGMIGAAFGIGFIIGPVLGGILGDIDTRLPFYVAAGLAGLNLLYGIFVLPESLKPENRRAFSLGRANPFGAFRHFSKLPRVSWFLVAAFIFALAHNVYPSTWNYHGAIRYDWSEAEIGWSLAAVGLGAALTQIFAIGPMVKRFGASRAALFGFFINVIALAAFAFAAAPWMAYAIIAVSALGGVASPALNSLTSNLTSASEQGELQGATASLAALAMIISPLLMTTTLHEFSKPDAAIYFPGAAFLLASALTLIAFIPLIIGIRINQAAVKAAEASA